MDKPVLYRQRIIPEEIILLDKDEILFSDDDHIVTRWNTIKPKKILHHGCSCYFLKKGFKVSKFYREDGSLMYWYCDIISYKYDPVANSYVFTDLLADVLIYPDGKVEVVDVGEIADALEDGTLTKDEMIPALRSLDKLLGIIYSGCFSDIQEMINRIEEENTPSK
jgi:predicted RNA-binding protein associated with RNAse of E/G family